MGERIRLDSAPLLAAIELLALKLAEQSYWVRVERLTARQARYFPKGTNANPRIDFAGARMQVAATIADRIGADKDATYNLIMRMRRGSLVDLYTADRVCAGLGKHLSEVYGDEWEAEPDPATYGGLPAANAAKTECPKGHAYDEVNTVVLRGRRFCRTCKRETNRLYAQRKRAMVA